ncbi:alpha/beta fold hydrolase [Mycobacterium scrofulaceum]|uniref:Uncharacterized protein n=1 Tax=Mycobacterium scrofulaceum TaxID=1783 RepID=A0A1X0KD53_MYCSC|nr:alpha/beta hydrolase [Mycobacterium scrofulaceum]ORB73107.1 hypothetical protein BST44_16175 [Mycobacterium scrofulaceum]
MRYFTAGTGPTLVLLHPVRTQLDYFQRVVPGARYDEPALRSAVVEFVRALDLRDATLAGESMGGALALLASIELADSVSAWSPSTPTTIRAGWNEATGSPT